MKIYTAILACLFITNVFSQNKDKQKETETKVVKITGAHGEVTEKKIKKVTTKEQEVKTDPKSKGTIDADRVFPPTKVTTRFYIDNDNDPFYDKVNKTQYYKFNEHMYDFNSSRNGLKFSTDATENVIIKNGVAYRSSSSPFYVVNSNNYNGVGYFDANNNFIIEYYDEKDMTLKTITFKRDN